jgi:hypothetical protein
MTPRLAALFMRVAELCDAGLQANYCTEELLFNEFTLSVTRTSWCMNAHGSMIQVMSLLLVRSLTLFIATDYLILLI